MLTGQKMRDNILTDDNSSDLISKNFRSHLKSKTNKSSLILETVPLDDIYCSDPELFNEHFYRQFTRPSNYNIPINIHTEEGLRIHYNSVRDYTGIGIGDFRNSCQIAYLVIEDE